MPSRAPFRENDDDVVTTDPPKASKQTESH